MELLTLETFPKANIGDVSELAADVAAAATSATVQNANGMATNKYIVIGILGKEPVEIKLISGVSGNVVSFSALTYAYKRFAPVTVVKGNKIRVYRAANVDGTPPEDADFSLLTTITIQPDKRTMEYADTSGGSDYWYKVTYFNAEADPDDETSLALSTAVRGGDYGHFASVLDIRQEAGFNDNPDVTDQMIADRREDAEGEVKGAVLTAGYDLPFTTGHPIPGPVRNATKLLAAGYLLLQDYGVGAEGTTKEGEKKIELANTILQKIIDRKIVLVGVTDTALQQDGAVDAWPDASTADAEASDAGGARIFRVSDKF